MKQAFTMIELIFVIVILGILAAVAIPKINANRDDAEVAKALNNMGIIVGDLASFYTSKGKLNDNIASMTNVGLNSKNQLMIKGKPCIEFKIINTQDGEFSIQMLDNANEICKKTLATDIAKSIFGDDLNLYNTQENALHMKVGGYKVDF